MDMETKILYGIGLSSETSLKDPKQDIPLGLLACIGTESLAECRDLMQQQCPAAPSQFLFLTAQGWPVSRQQEIQILVHQVSSENNILRLLKDFGQARVGITTCEGSPLGFIFVDLPCSVQFLRDSIKHQLGELKPRGGYQFVDRNGWPVMHAQEDELGFVDIVQDGCVRIRIVQSVDQALTLHDTLDGQSPHTQTSLSSNQGLKQLTFQDEKDADRLISVEEEHTYSHKDILLSYVRAEAAQHAVILKEKLTEMGYSVFLDVHEIKYGVDWQDALNHAVSNCEAFVPLVTPRYGETQWTNREVKLADVLSKFILPINFLDHWPPKCLAIQFATTQYIPCSTSDATQTDSDKCSNYCYRKWNDSDMQLVVSDIDSRLRLYDKQLKSLPALNIRKKMSMLRSCPVALPDEFAQLSQHREGRPLIVISLHPQQRTFCENLRHMLEDEGYEVWCSTDDSSCDDDKADLPLFSQDSNRSMTHGRPLLFSQMSDLSQVADEDPGTRDICRQFQEKADQAGLVIFVLSLGFAKSRTSQMHVYYCEHRKRVIPLRFEEFPMPGWMSMLIGTGIFEDANDSDFNESLKTRVRHILNNPKEETEDRVNEWKLSQEVSSLKQQMPKEMYVYIAGGTKFYNKKSESICNAIGKVLATLDNIFVVTGGFYGVGETVGKSYHSERMCNKEALNIWHILPRRDDKDRRSQAKQNEDKTFSAVQYGKTVFSGDCVRERENIVSRVFDICILVEGGPGAAHEAEQFAWNDHIVIPVRCTGGAAGGKFNVPEKIFELPPGVDESDWLRLSEKNASPEEIGQSVCNIVCSAKERLKVDSPTYGGPIPPRFTSSDESISNGSRRSSPLDSPTSLSPKRRKHPMTKAPTVTFKKDRK